MNSMNIMNIVLWIVQGLLALAFVFAGVNKGFLPLDNVRKNLAWARDVPDGLVRFIGVSELLGGIGLILPAATGIQSWLTIAAAGGLALVMLLATVFHISRREFSAISITIVLLLLALLIAIGRLVWI